MWNSEDCLYFSWCFVQIRYSYYFISWILNSVAYEMATLKVFYHVEVISFLPVCLLSSSSLKWTMFILFIFTLVGFIITGLPVKPLLLLCMLLSCQADFLLSCHFGVIQVMTRVRKYEPSEKSISHCPPKWKVSCLGLCRIGSQVRLVVGTIKD